MDLGDRLTAEGASATISPVPAPNYGAGLSGQPVQVPGESSPADSSRPSENPNASKHVLGWSVVAWVALTALSANVDPDHPSTAYRAGTAFVPVMIAAFATFFVIKSMHRRVRWLVYPLAVVLGSGVFYAAVSLPSVIAHARTGASNGPNQTVHLPQTVGPWHQLDDQATRARLATMREQSSQRLGYVPQLAYYGSADGTTIFVEAFVHSPPELQREIASSPGQAVVNMLGGVGVTHPVGEDPGNLGGAMACGTAPQAGGTPRPVCGWAQGTLGVEVVFVTGDLTLADASGRTKAFRESVTTAR